ncbi:MAG: TSUP family transporter, partial [Chloroflexota bacterium]
MTPLSAIVLFFAAMIAGALNSVAGGGSFITYPALVFGGVPVINANTTSTIALWPGSVASVGAYRNEIAAERQGLWP